MLKLWNVIRKETRMALWVLGIGLYLVCQINLYGQDSSAVKSVVADTPWEHLTLEGALALAVAVQYRENRAKETVARLLAVEAAGAITRATAMMVDVTGALERLCSKIDTIHLQQRG